MLYSTKIGIVRFITRAIPTRDCATREFRIHTYTEVNDTFIVTMHRISHVTCDAAPLAIERRDTTSYTNVCPLLSQI